MYGLREEVARLSSLVNSILVECDEKEHSLRTSGKLRSEAYNEVLLREAEGNILFDMVRVIHDRVGLAVTKTMVERFVSGEKLGFVLLRGEEESY